METKTIVKKKLTDLDYIKPYYMKGTDKFEVTTPDDLLKLVNDKDFKFGLGVGGAKISYINIEDKGDMLAKSTFSFSADGDKVIATRGTEVEEIDISDPDLDPNLKHIYDQGIKGIYVKFKKTTTPVATRDFKLITIQNFMFKQIDFKKHYKGGKDEAKGMIVDFAKDPDKIKAYISDTSSMWMKKLDVYCKRYHVTGAAMDRIKTEPTPEEFITVVASEPKKLEPWDELVKISKDAKEREDYIKEYDVKWSGRVGTYADINSLTDIEKERLINEPTEKEFLEIIKLPYINNLRNIELTYTKDDTGARNVWYGEAIHFISYNDDKNVIPIDDKIYRKIKKYFTNEPKPAKTMNDLDKMIANKMAEKDWRSYVSDRILMMSFVYQIGDGKNHRMNFVNEKIGLKDTALEASFNIAIEDLRDKMRGDFDATSQWEGTWNKQNEMKNLPTFKMFLESLE